MLTFCWQLVSLLSFALIFGPTNCDEVTEDELRYNDWNCRTNLMNRPEVDSSQSVIESYYNKSGDDCHIYCRVRKIGSVVTTLPQYYEMNMPNFKICGFLRMCMAGQCVGWYTPRIRPMRMVARGIWRMRQWRKSLANVPTYFDSDPNIKSLELSLLRMNEPATNVPVATPKPVAIVAPPPPPPSTPASMAPMPFINPTNPPPFAAISYTPPNTNNPQDELGLSQLLQNIGKPVPSNGQSAKPSENAV